MTGRNFDEPTPKTFVGEIIGAGEIVDFVIVEAVVEAVREENARERADRRWGMIPRNQGD